MELFSAIKPLRKKWACQISIEVAKNDKLLRSMKESGCILVLIGFESLNRKSLIEMNKIANLTQDYETAIQKIYRHKILIYATFVIGLDSDEKGTATQIFEFSMKHDFAIANFNPLMPMPGTRTFERLKSVGRLLNKKWWIDEYFRYGDTMFLPKSMTPEELADSCTKARNDFYSYKNIFIRMLRSLPRLDLYTFGIMLIANLASKKRNKKKKG